MASKERKTAAGQGISRANKISIQATSRTGLRTPSLLPQQQNIRYNLTNLYPNLSSLNPDYIFFLCWLIAIPSYRLALPTQLAFGLKITFVYSHHRVFVCDFDHHPPKNPLTSPSQPAEIGSRHWPNSPFGTPTKIPYLPRGSLLYT
jgi:hypothetical protein